MHRSFTAVQSLPRTSMIVLELRYCVAFEQNKNKEIFILEYEMRRQQQDKYGTSYIGNVIRIIDKRTVIINVGKKNLNVGDIVQIYEPSEPLKDIDGTVLCNFDFVKEELEVVRTENLYSVCKKMKTTSKPFNYALSPLLQGNITSYVPMKVNESDIEELEIKNPTVRVGDPVKRA